TDDDADAVFENTWTQNTDFVLEPLNAASDTEPWTAVRVQPYTSRIFYCWPRSLRVTGKFGWLTPPPAVKQATELLAARLLKRSREAPFGVVGLGLDEGAVRIPRLDPDVAALLGPYMRRRIFAA